MTFAPATLSELAAYWEAHGGVNLGVVGDAGHQQRGVSYHLGADHLIVDAYSRQTVRDRKPFLTNAASAIDLGRLDGSLGKLQEFSRWLAERCHDGAPGTDDIREVIYSPDGSAIRRWDHVTQRFFVGGDGTGHGDNTHLTHTHVSYYRDSEQRAKVPTFASFFERDDMAAVFNLERWALPAGTDLFDGPAGNRVTDLAVDSVITAVGPWLTSSDADGVNHNWRLCIVASQAIDDTSRRKLLWFKTPIDALGRIDTSPEWDAFVARCLGDPDFRGDCD